VKKASRIFLSCVRGLRIRQAEKQTDAGTGYHRQGPDLGEFCNREHSHFCFLPITAWHCFVPNLTADPRLEAFRTLIHSDLL